MKYRQLASAGNIGSMTVKNRFIMTAMGSNFAETDGACGERLQAYYEARAAGGVGLIILETTSVSWPSACSMPNMVGLSEDRFLPDLIKLVDRVHRHDCKIAAQLNHSGKVSQEDVVAGRPLLVPSRLSKSGNDMMSILTREELKNFIKMSGPDGKGARIKVMEQSDIDTVIADFADAAERCQRAGFDALEIHAGHGYLLASFLSPAVNKREDRYGGNLENRTRLLCEVIAAIKVRVGEDMPILVRLDAFEYRIENGISTEDCAASAKLVEAAGAAAIDVSAYGNTGKGIAFTEAPLVHQPNGFVGFATTIKRAVKIPVMAVGRIEMDSAEKHIAAGDFDFVGLGRKILADPALPQKIIDNQVDQIRPCIYCYICVSQIFINKPLVCAVNADLGREQELDVIARCSDPSQQVLVVGGGPGGMEAAIRLAEAGHRVTLVDKAPQLGGTARIAALAYEPNGQLIEYQIAALRRLGVTIRLNTPVNDALLKQLSPEQVIVATGARREAPPIPGKDLRHVFDGEQMRALLLGGESNAKQKLNWFDKLVVTFGQLSGITSSIKWATLGSRLYMPVGKHITIVGGGLVGVELAEFLVARGRKVTVIEPSRDLAPELSIVRRAKVLHELREDGCTLITKAEDIRCDHDGVRYKIDDSAIFSKADTIILALGAMGDMRIAEQIENAGYAVAVVGDCAHVGYIDGAVHSARETVNRLRQRWSSSPSDNVLRPTGT